MSTTTERTPRWLLPAELSDADGGRRRRTARDWFVDAILFLAAVLAGMWQVDQPEARGDIDTDQRMLIDLVIGGAMCVLLWWRRRIPLVLVWLMIPAQVAWSATGAVFVAVLTVAVHRPWRPTVIAVGAHLALTLPTVWAFGFGEPIGLALAMATLYFLLPMLWGMTVRSNRQLVLTLRREQRQLMTGARQAERRRIAREMHDTLAHRLSLVSVHAGALAYRTGTDPAGLDAAEVREATTVIQDSAQRAVVELGEVLMLLRAEDEDDVPAPDASPRSDIEDLAAEARTTGQPVTVSFDGDPDRLDRLSVRGRRTVHRVVQEALTNARKHAPDQPVTVTVVARDTGVDVEVVNPLPAVAVRGADGFGLGLAGLSERVDVDGGSLDHEARHGRFRLSARLPWTP